MLHIALRCPLFYDDGGVLDVVKVLVGCGCDPLEANFRGVTPLHVAVEQGHISAAQYLLTLNGALPSDLLATLNRDWSRWGTAAMIHFLTENGVNVRTYNSDGDSVLHIVLRCSNGDNDMLQAVKLLVSHGCDPLEANSCGNTPLYIAVQHGHISAAHYFLTLGAPLPYNLLVTLNRDRSHWSTATMVGFLVKNGVNVLAHANDGDSVLHTALRCFNLDDHVLEVVKLLVGYGCDPLEANSLGETPLHIAAERSYISVARYLITQGASIIKKASNGDTVLHFATRVAYPYSFNADDDRCALQAVEFFIGRGSETAAPNYDGQTPLHIAVDLGHVKTIKYLLSLNVPLLHDILFTAIQSDHNPTYRRYIIETLVNSGCDTWTPNSEGIMPLQAAVVKGKVDVVEYLLSATPVHKPPLEDLLSASTLAPPSVQSEMRRVLLHHLVRSEASSRDEQSSRDV